MARKCYTADILPTYLDDVNLDFNQPIIPDSGPYATDVSESLRSVSLYGIIICFWCT